MIEFDILCDDPRWKKNLKCFTKANVDDHETLTLVLIE